MDHDAAASDAANEAVTPILKYNSKFLDAPQIWGGRPI